MSHKSVEIFPGSGITLLQIPTSHKDSNEWCLGAIVRLSGDVGFRVGPGFVADAIGLLGLGRMGDIHQLQFITGVMVGSDAHGVLGSHQFPHTRLPHVLRAAVLHLQILMRAGVQDRRTVILGVWAELMHDAFLCAGGDSWKGSVQVDLFEEDSNFVLKLWHYYAAGWTALCRRYGFDPVSSGTYVERIVHGKGQGGEIHEVVDTASYMLGDLRAIDEFVKRSGVKHFDEILQFAKVHAWDVWTDICLLSAKVVVQDAQKLGNFIQLRALLWRWLYSYPEAKFVELLLHNIVYPYLLQIRAFPKSVLLQKGDSWLLKILAKRMGLRSVERIDLLGGWPNVQRFATQAEAQTFEAKLVAQGSVFTLLVGSHDIQQTSSKLGTYYVLSSEENLESFATAGNPQQVAVIVDLVESANEAVWYVFWVKSPALSRAMSEAWRQARLRWQ